MKMITVTEAARMLGVTPTLIRIYIRRGVFPGAVKVRGTRWQIPAAQVDLFDGADVSGVFAKRLKKPFCSVVPDRGDGTWFEVVTPTNFCIDIFEAKKDALEICKEINEAADQWAKGDK